MTGGWSPGADRGKGKGGEGAAAITSFPSHHRDPQAGPRVCPLLGQWSTLGGFGSLGQSPTASLDRAGVLGGRNTYLQAPPPPASCEPVPVQRWEGGECRWLIHHHDGGHQGQPSGRPAVPGKLPRTPFLLLLRCRQSLGYKGLRKAPWSDTTATSPGAQLLPGRIPGSVSA